MNRREFIKLCYGLSLVATPVGHAIAAAGKTGSGESTGILLDTVFLQHHIAAGHPESPRRLEEIIRIMERSGMLEKLVRLDVLRNIEPYLLTVHTREHIESIRKHYPESFSVFLAVVGGVLSAVDAVCAGKIRNAFCATRPPGHHAINTGKEEGFCYFNAVAIAARYAQKHYRMDKVLIVDWDYHHGNGTEAAFYDDPSVLFFSTHDLFAYPGTGYPDKTGEGAGKGYNINIHLGCGTNDDDILTAFHENLLPALTTFKPDLILISAGFDSREKDLLGCYDVTDQGFVKLTRLVMDIAEKNCSGRIVSILEGGYNVTGNASAVLTHVRTLMS